MVNSAGVIEVKNMSYERKLSILNLNIAVTCWVVSKKMLCLHLSITTSIYNVEMIILSYFTCPLAFRDGNQKATVVVRVSDIASGNMGTNPHKDEIPTK